MKIRGVPNRWRGHCRRWRASLRGWLPAYVARGGSGCCTLPCSTRASSSSSFFTSSFFFFAFVLSCDRRGDDEVRTGKRSAKVVLGEAGLWSLTTACSPTTAKKTEPRGVGALLCWRADWGTNGKLEPLPEVAPEGTPCDEEQRRSYILKIPAPRKIC